MHCFAFVAVISAYSSCKTSPQEISVKHFLLGHAAAFFGVQGEHGVLRCMIRALDESGKNLYIDEFPKMATCGISKAAAICMSPESAPTI